jgi:hypothetical protein
MKTITISTILLFLVCTLHAQDFFDALRYSQTNYGGTARSVAMGSAFGAVGGDFISASINPAGLGIYRKSEIAFSPTLNINNVQTSYLGTTISDNKYNFNFNNLSYVGAVNTGIESGIVSVTFGVGYNRLKNFHSNYRVEGNNAKTSLLNYYTDWANAINNPDNFDYHFEGLAWNTWLIDEDQNMEVIEGIYYNDLANYENYDINDNNGTYVGKGYRLDPVDPVKPHFQRKTVNTTGRLDEYLFSTAININHRFFIGASLGLLDLEYRELATFRETDNLNLSNFINYYEQESDLSHSGVGLNFKIGAIWKPIKSIRIGASVHTPSFYTITTRSKKAMDAYFDQQVGNQTTGYNTYWNDKNTLQPYDFRLETPLKAVFSGAYQLGSFAIFSADYEYINYGSTKFRHAGDNYDYSDKNNEIQKVYKSTGNVRVGAEIRATPNMSLRAGYGLIGNPWNSTYTFDDGTTGEILNKNDMQSSYSAGFGYRQNSFFLDFAYRLTNITEKYKVHEMSNDNILNINKNIADYNGLVNQATLTIGFRF